MRHHDKILILGASGLVGSALYKTLTHEGFRNILRPSRAELDLCDQLSVYNYFKTHAPQYIFMTAGRVGGIAANDKYRANAIWENTMMACHVFEAARRNIPEKLLYYGSSCIYPKNAEQPIKEGALLSGNLEPTNEPYAIAKIAGLKMAESFRRQYNLPFYSIMPCNLYGENDNFDPQTGHVIPALVARMTEAVNQNAPEFCAWGTGRPLREFMHVDDLARASIIFMHEANQNTPYWVNAGSGDEISIKDLTALIADIVGYKGDIVFDKNMPDGTMRKVMDSSYLRSLDWQPGISLQDGLKAVVRHYCGEESNISNRTSLRRKNQGVMGLL